MLVRLMKVVTYIKVERGRLNEDVKEWCEG